MTATRLSTGLTVSLVCLGLTTVVWRYRPVHWVRTHSFTSSLFWTVRSWLWNYPLTPNFEIWDEGDPRHNEKWKKEKVRTVRIWDFLAPYFAERGYTLYVREKLADPLSKRNDRDFEVNIVASRVWAARDTEGRDVIIKAISGAVPTNELRALQLLHSEPLCNDPRNHTIPVIEYIEFNQQTFVVMPRWSDVVLCDFSTVGEIIRYARTFLEALAFLHENNITHGDITSQNMSMDVLMPCAPYPEYYVGYHGPERKYAFIDFEVAELPTVTGAPSSGFEQSSTRDIAWLAHTLEIHLRCIEHVVPGMNDFLTSIGMDKWESLPTATAVLSSFDELCLHLSSEKRNLPLEAYRWDSGLYNSYHGFKMVITLPS
ncbi:hypothetical protein Agabi119p4_8372 [Agaricus bisporus var. burnettii]|uniref:Protein kinase domain-containing protein n=1 Tax=Agaricus bisporus var. burnettii TaxID=192524 RepID=A0A8H7C645_AGABI|nr:hypothetical protein Agabi119p4_8372 [Agaricus bisporus var. burnettii]